MSMAIARYRSNDLIRWGVVREGRIAPLSGDWPSTRAFLSAGGPEAAAAVADADFVVDEADVSLESPVSPDAQVVCLGANYGEHRKESGVKSESTYNMLFRKASSCLSSARGPIVRPAHVALLDYEIELGLILGTRIDGPVDVTDENLAQYVAALTTINDISARDIQIPQGQFYKGKSYRTFGPTGPYMVLVSASELARWPDLRLTLAVDGDQRQSALANEMIHGPAATLTELSGLMDLQPGDLIATGTPGGVALQPPSPFVQKIGGLLPDAVRWRAFIKGQMKSDRYLRPGQIIEARIATDDGTLDLGQQRTPVIGEG